jgi:hypothetical protein
MSTFHDLQEKRNFSKSFLLNFHPCSISTPAEFLAIGLVRFHNISFGRRENFRHEQISGIFNVHIFFDRQKILERNGLEKKEDPELVDFEQLSTHLRISIRKWPGAPRDFREIQQAAETTPYPLVGNNSFPISLVYGWIALSWCIS